MVCTVLARGMANGLSAEAMRQADEATLTYVPLSTEAARVSRWHARGKDTCTTSSWAFDKRHIYVRRILVSGHLLKELWRVLLVVVVLFVKSLCFRDSPYTHISRVNTLLLLTNSLKPVFVARGRWGLGLVFLCYDFCLFACFAKQMLESGYEGGYQHKASAFWPTFLVRVLTDEQ